MSDDKQALEFYREDMYLRGNFAPVDVETTLTELEVIGNIPEELTGRFLRNGPNPLNDVNPSSHHWFIGDGMLHGVRLEEGRADWYRNRWVRSERIIEDLGESLAGRNLQGSCNTSVIGHAGKTWAIMESGTPPTEMGYELETLGHTSGWGGFSAHPKLDPDTGEIHAISYDWAEYRDHVKYRVVNADGTLASSTDIPLASMAMIHDMSLTKNYAVIFDLPVTLSFMMLATGSRFPFRWNPDSEARIGLMPRGGKASDITWSSMSQAYAYHPVNAYEDDEGKVVIDVCRYDKMFDADTNGPFGDSQPTLDRWTVDPKTQTVAEQRIDDRTQEFPRCHPDLNSKPYQYAYTVAVEGTAFPAIYKHDMRSGQSWSFEFGNSRHGGEPVFIPREHARTEDDGYLVTFVYDGTSKSSELVIIDAQDLSRPPLAQVKLPVRVPYGFHGNWIADSQSS